MRNEAEWNLSDKLHAFLCDHVYAVKYAEWTMTKIDDKARQRTHGDLKFVRGESVAYIDEKAYASVWDGCLIELIQDIDTKDLGWLFTLDHCTHLICGYYPSRDAPEPQEVYKIPWLKLRGKYWELCERDGLWHKGTANGYGKTLFAKIPWDDVPDLEVLWPGSTPGKCSVCGAHVYKDGMCEDCAIAEEGWNSYVSPGVYKKRGE